MKSLPENTEIGKDFWMSGCIFIPYKSYECRCVLTLIVMDV